MKKDENIKNSKTETASAKKNVKFETIKNALVKVACLLIALLMWFYVMSNESPDYEKTFNSIPVSILGVSELENDTGMSVISGQGHVVDITVAGKKSDVIKLTTEEISAQVSVADLKNPDKYALDLSVAVPGGITVTAVSPDNVTVSIDKTSSVMVDVVAKTTSYTLPSGYTLGIPVAEVDEISVSGPITVLNTIDHAEVVIGDLGHITGTVTASGEISLVDANGKEVSSQYVKISRESVKVTVPVNVTKEIPVNVSYEYGFYNDSNVNVKVTPEVLKVKGDVSLVSSLEEYSVVINEKKITDDTTSIYTVSLPTGIENVDGVENISVEIKHKNTSIRSVVVDNVYVNNPKNLKCEVLTETLTVSFRGPSSLLAKLTKDNIIVTADIENVSPNPEPIEVPVSVKTLVGNSVYEIGEYKVELRVS